MVTQKTCRTCEERMNFEYIKFIFAICRYKKMTYTDHINDCTIHFVHISELPTDISTMAHSLSLSHYTHRQQITKLNETIVLSYISL